MAPLTIEGINIDFPYEPYPNQLAYMEKVIQCLNRGWNGALESPTGTGKTLCLLCASLGWLQAHKAKMSVVSSANPHEQPQQQQQIDLGMILAPPKVLYTSRTHSQLSQVVKELNKTLYKNLRVCVLGSRDQMCLNEEVRSEPSIAFKNLKCRVSVTSRKCPFYLEFDNHRSIHNRQYDCGKVLDIEDFVRIGRKTKVCPYYQSREAFESADLVLLPYNYVLDNRTRQANKIELKGNVVIFDEAHNLENICEEGASVSLRSRDVSACLREGKQALEAIIKEEEEFRQLMDETTEEFGKCAAIESRQKQRVDKDDFAHLLILLEELEKQIDAVDIGSSGSPVPNQTGKIFPTSFMHELLSKAGIKETMRDSIMKIIDAIRVYLTHKSSSSGGIWSNQGRALEQFSTFISTVYPPLEQSAFLKDKKEHDGFLLYIAHDDTPNKGKISRPGLVLHYWCFSAGKGMQALTARQLRSVIVTSGTLSPLENFVRQMNIPFQITLENDHVITKSQVWMGVLPQGPDGVGLSSSYHNRSNQSYLNSLGQSLVNICRLVPQGVLVFFASYAQLNACVQYWKENKVWEALSQRKAVFVEPKSKTEFNDLMLDFDRKVCERESKGAVLMAVCRGKVSEGIDFSDKHGRAVVLVGIPYPPLMDARVCLKKTFLQQLKQEKRTLAEVLGPDQWYNLEAVRAVNQALGRVIRHKADFGAIILADSRFARWPTSHFPSWLRNSINECRNFGKMQSQLGAFFRSHGLRPGASVSNTTQGSAFGFSSNKLNQSAEKRDLYNIFNGVPKEQTFLKSTTLVESNCQAECSTSSSDPVVSKCQKRPAASLAALEMMEECPAAPSVSVSPSISSLKRIPSSPVAPSRKRIKLKVNSGRASGGTEEQDWRTMTPEGYRALLKRELSVDLLRDFLDISGQYKKTGDYNVLLEHLRRTLLPHSEGAFKGFYSFLRRDHRKEFEDFCRQHMDVV